MTPILVMLFAKNEITFILLDSLILTSEKIQRLEVMINFIKPYLTLAKPCQFMNQSINLQN
jgi:hypothetical protein